MPATLAKVAGGNAPSTGAAYIAEFLIQQGVPYVFGLCGHGILGLLDGLFDRRQQIKTISVHHESVAAFMADAYFRVTKKPVATYTSCGPGSTNLIVAVAVAKPPAMTNPPTYIFQPAAISKTIISGAIAQRATVGHLQVQQVAGVVSGPEVFEGS